jgi:hypothetical protein
MLPRERKSKIEECTDKGNNKLRNGERIKERKEG